MTDLVFSPGPSWQPGSAEQGESRIAARRGESFYGSRLPQLLDITDANPSALEAVNVRRLIAKIKDEVHETLLASGENGISHEEVESMLKAQTEEFVKTRVFLDSDVSCWSPTSWSVRNKDASALVTTHGTSSDGKQHFYTERKRFRSRRLARVHAKKILKSGVLNVQLSVVPVHPVCHVSIEYKVTLDQGSTKIELT